MTTEYNKPHHFQTTEEYNNYLIRRYEKLEENCYLLENDLHQLETYCDKLEADCDSVTEYSKNSAETFNTFILTLTDELNIEKKVEEKLLNIIVDLRSNNQLVTDFEENVYILQLTIVLTMVILLIYMLSYSVLT